MSNPLDEALAQMDERLGTEEASPEETPSPAEEAPAEEAATVDEPPDEQASDEPSREERLQAYLEKYGGDIDKAYEASVHAQQKIGQQNYELGELRKRLDQQPEPQQPTVPPSQATADWFDEQIDKNPYGAAEWARQNDPSGVLWNRAMDYWYELGGADARQAAAYERSLELGQIKYEFQQQLQQTAQPLAEQEMVRAFRDASEAHPDVKDNLRELLQAAAQNSPLATQTLIDTARAGDYDTKVQVFDGIIKLAKGENIAAVRQAVQAAGDEDAAKARQMKQSGGVATQTQAVQPEVVDADEQWLRDNFDKHLAPAE